MVPGDEFWVGFGRFSEVSRMFSTGVSPPVVRWEVSYEAKSFQKKFEIWSGPKFRKMSQIGQGGPPRHPKNQKRKWAQKGLGPIWGPGSLYNSRSTRLRGPYILCCPQSASIFDEVTRSAKIVRMAVMVCTPREELQTVLAWAWRAVLQARGHRCGVT